MKFSECLKLARQQKGLSQKQLAQLLNVPVSTINRYENDNTEPRISTVIEIAEILNMSIDELLRLPCGSNGFPLSPVTNEEHAEMAHAYNFLTQKFFNVEFKDDKGRRIFYITKISISTFYEY